MVAVAEMTSISRVISETNKWKLTMKDVSINIATCHMKTPGTYLRP